MGMEYDKIERDEIMKGIDLINKIKEIGEEKEVIIIASGACEGIYCNMERKIDDVRSYKNKIILDIDVDAN